MIRADLKSALRAVVDPRNASRLRPARGESKLRPCLGSRGLDSAHRVDCAGFEGVAQFFVIGLIDLLHLVIEIEFAQRLNRESAFMFEPFEREIVGISRFAQEPFAERGGHEQRYGKNEKDRRYPDCHGSASLLQLAF
jgi:hypothetical protein